ncbi:MAG TPA: sigma-70 family RNA polymerase sigma factor [Frankiaceae bacterium]|nr:sigma-70 family RNA polymerase sigma factor [Frankiaceae bacterium]
MTEAVLGTAGAGELPPSLGVPFRAETLREFQQLYEEQFGGLAAYCAGLVDDTNTGSDIAQEAFTRLFARWRSVRHHRAYVYFVATNLVRAHWRTRRDERVAVRELGARGDAVSPAGDPSLRDLVERLPGKLRTVVLLHYYADLPVDEIARLIHRPAGTVKQRLHEARRRLQRAMEDR